METREYKDNVLLFRRKEKAPEFNIENFVEENIDSLVEEANILLRQKCNDLNNTEWQRWTPILGVYRLFKDQINDNQSTFNAMHSPTYEFIVTAYNVTQTIALSGGAIVGIQSLLEKLM